MEILIEFSDNRGKALIYDSIKDVKSYRDALHVKEITNLVSERTNILILTENGSARIPRDWIYKFEMRDKFDV